MKILHITDSLLKSGGGVAQVVNGLANAQTKLGHDVNVIASRNAGKKDEVFRPEEAKVSISGQDNLGKIWKSHSPEVRHNIKENIIGTDIVHIHGIWHYPAFLGSKLAYKGKIPYIIAPHGSLDPWCLDYRRTKKNLYMGLVQRRQLLRASLIHAISDAETAHVKTLLPDVRIRTIHNGVSFSQVVTNEDRVFVEQIFPWLEKHRIVLFLGRLHPIKGIDILIKAFSEAKRTQIKHALVIAGPDEVNLKNELEELARKLGVKGKTFFTGLVEGAAKRCLLSAAEMLVSPSHSEGFSISILEAMAFSKPVVISTGCDFPEVAVEGAGIVVRPDPHELAKAMDRISCNMELAKEMGANGRRLVEEKYSWAKIAGDTIEMYNEAIDAARCANISEPRYRPLEL